MATTCPVSLRSTACCGSQPVRALADPLSSSALRKAWLTNGLPSPAQVSHSAAGTSAIFWCSVSVSVAEPSGMGASLTYLEHPLHLQGGIGGQRWHANRGAGVTAGLTEHRHREVGGAVHHQRVLRKIRWRGD